MPCHGGCESPVNATAPAVDKHSKVTPAHNEKGRPIAIYLQPLRLIHMRATIFHTTQDDKFPAILPRRRPAAREEKTTWNLTPPDETHESR